MTGNRYVGLGLLATHPAFSHQEAALVCPLCPHLVTSRAAEYDRHFLSHDPTQEQAYEWLSGRTYDRLAARRDWPDTEHMVSAGKG